MRKIILGVSGGIAAYKSAELLRLLIKQGYEVEIILTENAQKFIAPLTFQALSGKPVHCNLLNLEEETAMTHIRLARWADYLLIAPATADLIARMAMGQANDLLTTMYLATKAQVIIAPAMNQVMWSHPQVQANIAQLKSNGACVIGPDVGIQACGETGLGRMIEPNDIISSLAIGVMKEQWVGKTVLITAGPTREAIDPVRFLSNKSSGKMGYALARAAVMAGARVILVSGPVHLTKPPGLYKFEAVISAEQMANTVNHLMGNIDIFIGCAAVSDYKTACYSEHKIKKSCQNNNQGLTIDFVKNPDIISMVAQHPNRPKLVVGFAAETCHTHENALKKLDDKKLDFICLNDVSSSQIGFDSNDNMVTVFSRDGAVQVFSQNSKEIIARQIIELIANYQNKSEP